MKINLSFILGLAIIAGCWSNAAHADDEADHAALRMIRTNYQDAVNSGDLTKIKNDLSKDVTGVMVTGRPVEGYDGLVTYWKEVQALIGPGGTYQVTVNVDKTDIFGEVAVSRGTTEEAIRLAGGKELNFSAYWTGVCHKEDGVWKVFRVEATLNPVDNVFVALQLKKARLVTGIVGALSGAVLALVIRRLFCRKKV